MKADFLTLNRSDLIAVEREYCGRSLRNFTKRAWKVLEPETELRWGWALDAVSEHLQAVVDGQIKKLLINVPPGHMKSLLSSVMLPAFEWGPMKKPHMRYLGTSHKLDLAIRDNVKCRRLIQSEWYQRLWSVKLTQDQNMKTKFENDKLGFREAMAFTSLTGSRGDRVILDDPLSVDGAESEAELEAVEKTFTESLPTRLNDQNRSAVIVIMQRLHERDPSGVIMSRDLPYTKLILPMRYEADRKCHTILGFTDPRQEDGELLFPELFPEEAVASLEKTMGGPESYAVAGQFQQRPAPRGGGLFKEIWFKELPEEPKKGVRWVRGWDFAASKNKRAAWTAGAKVGIDKDGRVIIADVRRKRGTPFEVEELVLNTAKADGRRVKGSIPKDPGQAGIAQVDHLIKKLIGFRYTATPESGSKETRAGPLASQAEAGNVYLVKGGWNKDFIEEATKFPTGRYKDQIDAASRAFAELIGGSNYSLDNL